MTTTKTTATTMTRVCSLSNASLRGSHGLSARRVQRIKSSRPEGPKAGPKGCQLEVGAQMAPRLLVYTYYIRYSDYEAGGRGGANKTYLGQEQIKPRLLLLQSS